MWHWHHLISRSRTCSDSVTTPMHVGPANLPILGLRYSINACTCQHLITLCRRGSFPCIHNSTLLSGNFPLCCKGKVETLYFRACFLLLNFQKILYCRLSSFLGSYDHNLEDIPSISLLIHRTHQYSSQASVLQEERMLCTDADQPYADPVSSGSGCSCWSRRHASWCMSK
jgi:hypothetical protein